MTIDEESSPDRLALALSLILEGRSVAFPGFSLSACDGVLRVDVDYPAEEPNNDLAGRQVLQSLSDLERLLRTCPGYHDALNSLLRRIALIWSNGKGEVEVATISDASIRWH